MTTSDSAHSGNGATAHIRNAPTLAPVLEAAMDQAEVSGLACFDDPSATVPGAGALASAGAPLRPSGVLHKKNIERSRPLVCRAKRIIQRHDALHPPQVFVSSSSMGRTRRRTFRNVSHQYRHSTTCELCGGRNNASRTIRVATAHQTVTPQYSGCDSALCGRFGVRFCGVSRSGVRQVLDPKKLHFAWSHTHRELVGEGALPQL